MEGQYSTETALLAVQLTLKCLESEPKNRPAMKEVVETLKQTGNKQKIPKLTLLIRHLTIVVNNLFIIDSPEQGEEKCFHKIYIYKIVCPLGKYDFFFFLAK